MLGILDYYNLRFQGLVEANQPQGIGFIMDHNLLFSLAQWHKGQIQGKVFIMFPSSKVFCGTISNNQPNGIGCFYLQDKVQIYVNYSLGKDASYIAVLPFCKVILQIKSKKQASKAQRHLVYKSQQDLIRQLNEILGISQGIQHFLDWKSFVKNYLVEPNKIRIELQVKNHQHYYECFLGFKYQGLGVKIHEFKDQNFINSTNKSTLAVQMGMFSTERKINGIGKKLKATTNYNQCQQGIFEQQNYQTHVYCLNQRPTECNQSFMRHLKSSMQFCNKFLNLNQLYKLENAHAGVSIKMVEQTQKIAQIVLQTSSNKGVVVAQIAHNFDLTRNLSLSRDSFKQKEEKLPQELKQKGVKFDTFHQVLQQSKAKANQPIKGDKSLSKQKKNYDGQHAKFILKQLQQRNERLKSSFRPIQQQPQYKNNLSSQQKNHKNLSNKNLASHFDELRPSQRAIGPIYQLLQKSCNQSVQVIKNDHHRSSFQQEFSEPLIKRVNKMLQKQYQTGHFQEIQSKNMTNQRFDFNGHLRSQKQANQEYSLGFFNKKLQQSYESFSPQKNTFSTHQRSTQINSMSTSQKSPGKIVHYPRR